MRRWMLLVALCFLALGGVKAYAQKIYLVSAGISDYPGEANDLTHPAKDAKQVQWIYDQNKKAETVLLTDGRASKANILRNLQNLFSKAGEDDIIVFFFSGHGSPGTFHAYDGNLTYKEVRNVMAASKSRHKMVFADACFTGNMRGNNNRSGSSSSLKKLDVMLFLSSRSNETSIDNSSDSYSVFTAALEKALRGNADANRDRKITAKELYTFVSKEVVVLSRGAQHPVMWGKFSDDMPVIVW